jgi:DNA-binding IclR family transcriptional regulator
MSIALALKDVADRQDRTAQVSEHDHSVALVGAPNRVAHKRVVGAECAVGTAARNLDPNLWTGHLACKFRNAAREIRAMRDNYDANHLRSSPRLERCLAAVYSIEDDSTMPNSNKSSTRRATIQSVDRAARILKVLASGPRRLGVSEIADRLDLARPTVHGLLQTLQAHGFVEQERDSDKYQLGAGLLQLGNSYLDLNELRSRSLVHAERLAARADAAVRVGVMHGDRVVIVHHAFRPDSTLQILEVGAELPLHASALGKAMLAYAPEHTTDDLMAEPLPRLTSRTLTPAALRNELNDVRERGFAREKDEAILGESSIASPIFDHSGHAVGAIGVVGDSDRILPRGAPRQLTSAVVEAARGISRELGASRWPARGAIG